MAFAISIAGTTSASAVETPQPTPTGGVATATPTPAASPSTAAPSPVPSSSASPTPEVSPTPEPTAAPSAAARAVAGSAVPALDITLPAGYTLAQLNASKDKIPASPSTEAHATATLTDGTNPANNLTGVSLEEIKGRGNFTWLLDKKPYQIKFDSSTPVLGLPSAKTWILLANHADPSLLRNKTALELASQFGLVGTPDARFVDLTINGEFLGNYLLTEKVEVKKNRLDLKNAGGLLLELDNSYGRNEEFFFTTKTSKTTFVLKDAVQKVASPLPAELAASYQSVQVAIDAFESALYAPDPDWAAISSMIDVDSFITYYFALEFSENPDAVASSVYLWRDGPNDVLHAGPAWDFDIAMGLYPMASFGGEPTEDYMMNALSLRKGGTAWYQELFRNPEFAQRASEVFDTRLRPAVDGVVARLDADIAALSPSAAANFTRWSGVLDRRSVIAGARPVAATWAAEAAFVRDWVQKRVNHLAAKYSAAMPVLAYAAHSAQVGWQPSVTAGQYAGTTGRGLPLEAMSLELTGGMTAGQLQSRAHVQNIGWTPWSTGAESIGTTGQALRMEAVGFSLTARLAADYDIFYRAHVQNIGWMPWVSNGEVAGTTGRGLQVESVQVRILKKSPSTAGSTVRYSSHVSQEGWLPVVSDGATSGAIGRDRQMEAVQAAIESSEYDGTLSSRAHVQDIGWTEWADSPSVVGTEGRALRLEALQLRLQGEIADHYRVRYSAYVDGGWREWVTGGQTAGTTGQAKRIEAVRIELVPKS
ncbi:hypothetical protein DBR36_03030 [Microbacterium sp. HMWF026]|uniref:CotH kinase family protein n=1 Tax=Microbacterium sp. HMWF026 TaxID=2056861 RepID=UPI000D3B82C5|nr:CotH kinase family protein [Microbacterium sp. HMWF026]PTT21877.1 hypothetical protein DBR36_03030 [Microbacterium sp. HMWF026]